MLHYLRALACVLFLCFLLALLHARNVLFRNNRTLRAGAEADTAPAAQGHAVAREFPAATQEKGGKMSQDAAQEIEGVRKAAEQGDAEAQRKLGWRYEKGHGVPQDYAQAAVWYRRAAEQGYDDAREALVPYGMAIRDK